MKEALAPGKEFWDSEDTIKFLSETDYFRNDNEIEAAEWPEALKNMLDNGEWIMHRISNTNVLGDILVCRFCTTALLVGSNLVIF